MAIPRNKFMASMAEAGIKLEQGVHCRRVLQNQRVPLDGATMDFGLILRDPGEVVRVVFMHEKGDVVLRGGGTKVKIVPNMLVITDPEGKFHRHEYVFAPLGQVLDSEYPLVLVGIYDMQVSENTVMPVALYEKVIPDAMRDEVEGHS